MHGICARLRSCVAKNNLETDLAFIGAGEKAAHGRAEDENTVALFATFERDAGQSIEENPGAKVFRAYRNC